MDVLFNVTEQCHGIHAYQGCKLIHIPYGQLPRVQQSLAQGVVVELHVNGQNGDGYVLLDLPDGLHFSAFQGQFQDTVMVGRFQF